MLMKRLLTIILAFGLLASSGVNAQTKNSPPNPPGANPTIARFEFDKKSPLLGRFIIAPTDEPTPGSYIYQLVLTIEQTENGQLASYIWEVFERRDPNASGIVFRPKNKSEPTGSKDTLKKTGEASRIDFLVNNKTEPASFKGILEKTVEWADTATKNKVTDFEKPIGTFKLNGGEVTAAFKVSKRGSPECVLTGALPYRQVSLHYSPEQARITLFALNALDEALVTYKKQITERDALDSAAKKKKDDLFK